MITLTKIHLIQFIKFQLLQVLKTLIDILIFVNSWI